MATYVGLLRAVNVGGTGKLAMKDLAQICRDTGCANVRTYIQSGNVIFETDADQDDIHRDLENALALKMGKKIDLFLRTASEMRSVLEANPFGDAEGSKVAIVFLSSAVDGSVLDHVAAPGGEQVRPGSREVYIYYPDGMGRSKLKLPSSIGPATARNVNTVAKLAAMAIR